jgi:hypothetical protein
MAFLFMINDLLQPIYDICTWRCKEMGGWSRWVYNWQAGNRGRRVNKWHPYTIGNGAVNDGTMPHL